jgi:SOS-response transcriptional repressor LexA
MDDLTEIQKKVLLFLFERESLRKSPPTRREINIRFEWSSNVASRGHLLALERKGYIRLEARESRGIELLEKAREAYAALTHEPARMVSP